MQRAELQFFDTFCFEDTNNSYAWVHEADTICGRQNSCGLSTAVEFQKIIFITLLFWRNIYIWLKHAALSLLWATMSLLTGNGATCLGEKAKIQLKWVHSFSHTLYWDKLTVLLLSDFVIGFWVLLTSEAAFLNCCWTFDHYFLDTWH